MKNTKRFFCLLTLALFGLVLLTGCGSPDDKLSDRNAIEAYGTMIWGDELIDVCFTHDQEKIYIYYNDGDYALFNTVDLPVEDFHNDDTYWCITYVDSKDITGNGYSDLRVYIDHLNKCESSIFWTWSEDAACYVYRPDDSSFYYSNVIYGPTYDETEIDFSLYEGVWIGSEDNLNDNMSMEFDHEGGWRCYSDGELIDEGYLYMSEESVIYLCSSQDGNIGGGSILPGDEWIYISNLGYFDRFKGSDVKDDENSTDEPEEETEDNRNSTDEPENENNNNMNSTVKTEDYDGSYDWNEKLEQRNVSHFEGTWYLDAELWSLNYIIIDENGNWSYYQRPSEDDEGTEMDYGTLTYSTNEERTYYAESDLYDGLRFKVVEFVEGIFDWGDDGTYYLMDGTEDDYYDWNAKLHQVNISHFEGVWYYDYDTSADTYIIIDGDGSWSYYQRESGEDVGTVIDRGTLTYSTEEGSMYYADSDMNDGVRYKVLWFDDKILVWGDKGAYYLMD